MAEVYLPIPSDGQPPEERKPVASEAKIAVQPGPWFEAGWVDPQNGLQHEPYERFWDARARVLQEHNRGAQAVYVLHIPTNEIVFAIQRGRVAPGCNLREQPPVPPR